MGNPPTPLVSREALHAFTQRLVECYAPEKVILYSCGEAFGYGSLARGEGRHLAKIREMRRLCPVRFPLDLLVRRPEEVEIRYLGGDPVVREALDRGEMLHAVEVAEFHHLGDHAIRVTNASEGRSMQVLGPALPGVLDLLPGDRPTDTVFPRGF